MLSTKDRKAAAVVQPAPPAADTIGSNGPAASAGSVLPILADIRSLYCMPDGEPASQPLHTDDTSLPSTNTRLHAALEAHIPVCVGTGEYWCEYCCFYTADDIGELAKECGQPIPLPTDFDRRRELLKGIDRLHCRLADVTGGSAAQPLVFAEQAPSGLYHVLSLKPLT